MTQYKGGLLLIPFSSRLTSAPPPHTPSKAVSHASGQKKPEGWFRMRQMCALASSAPLLHQFWTKVWGAPEVNKMLSWKPLCLIL